MKSRSPQSSRNHWTSLVIVFIPPLRILTQIFGHFSLLWCCQFSLDQLGKANNEAFFLPSEKLLLLQIEWQNIKCYPHISSYGLRKLQEFIQYGNQLLLKGIKILILYISKTAKEKRKYKSLYEPPRSIRKKNPKTINQTPTNLNNYKLPPPFRIMI